MKTIRCTITQARAIRARLDTALGFPRPAQESDRIGGGRHVPLDRAGSTTAVHIRRLRGSTDVLVRVPREWASRLTAAQRALEVDPATIARDAVLDASD